MRTTMEQLTSEEMALRAQIESNPVLLQLYLAAKRLAAIRLRGEMWGNLAWALTPTATPTPRPSFPPLPWHTRPSADPQVTAIQQLAEADARRDVEADPTGEGGDT
ncbi:MAG: hypothetical protein U0792_00655 [Gemmataceae bacterium]